MATFTLVSHPGKERIHVEHPWEVCNVDDAVHVEKIDEATMDALLEAGSAVRCEHCLAEDDPQLLNTRGDAP
jgi:hypothetical protein